jgi:hypothetical protein
VIERRRRAGEVMASEDRSVVGGKQGGAPRGQRVDAGSAVEPPQADGRAGAAAADARVS